MTARAIEAMAGLLAVLLVSSAPAAAEPPMLGLPAPPQPAALTTPEAVALGRKLFLDRRLSGNGTMSCAMCHVPEQGFAQNGLATSVGSAGRSLRRNAPTLLNVAFHAHLFHDGRETSLEAQAWSPLLAENEMANASAGDVVARVAALPDYAGRFERAFAGAPVSRATIGRALAAYQRSLVAGGSRFDRWWFGGDKSAMSDEERRGFHLFRFRAGCAQCHSVDDDHALFTDQRFHNTGTGHDRAAALERPVRVELAPGLVAEVTREALLRFGEKPADDLGRMEVTRDPADRWKYRTPSLRNVALTAPYMHDGSLATLEEVVAFYDRGGGADPDRADYLFPLGLSDADRRALVAFLKTLTGSNVGTLANEARNAPQ